MTFSFNKSFILIDPRVLAVDAHTGYDSDDHLLWACSYSTEKVHNDARVVIASLHGVNSEASFTVTVGSLFLETGVGDTASDLEAALAQSEALETLYDLCRIQARTAVGMLALEHMIDIPLKAPEAELSPLGERDELDEDAELDLEPGTDAEQA